MALPDNRLTRPAPSYYHDDVDTWMRHLGQPTPADIPPSIIDDVPEWARGYSRPIEYPAPEPEPVSTRAVTPRHPNVFDSERLERVIKGLR